jgi:hypothetical protein
METLIVLVVALALVISVALTLRRLGRLNPRRAQGEGKDQRAESWLPRGGGRG